MSKRNFILLIIGLIIVVVIIFIFFYFYRGPSNPTTDSGGTNFISYFNPFNRNKTPTTDNTPTENTPIPEQTPTEEINIKLKKISSMPIAGFGIFTKERFKEVPVVIPPANTTAPGIGEFDDEIDSIPILDDSLTPLPVPSKTTKVVTKKPTPPPTEFITNVRYVARETGNIYQTFADKINEQKFSTTIVPQVYEAYLGSKGESVVMRYLKSDDRIIETFTGSLPKELLGADETGLNETRGIFLPEDISDMSISPDLLKIFYLFNVENGVVGITAGVLGDKKIQIFDSPFTEWLSYWPNKDIITLTTKPSAGVLGYMYSINPAKKDFNKILGGISGLTTLMSPDGKNVLYGDSGLSLYVYNINTRNVTILPVKSLPEKCVWTKTNDTVYCGVPKFITQTSFPDVWYKGETSFSDDIWKIDTKTGNGIIVVDPLTVLGGEEIDGIKLGLDKDENYLFFVNKKDSYLWELNLK